MKVILLSDVKNVGKKDDIVEVADGYARNFLLKRRLAVPHTQGSMKVLGIQKEEVPLVWYRVDHASWGKASS